MNLVHHPQIIFMFLWSLTIFSVFICLVHFGSFCSPLPHIVLSWTYFIIFVGMWKHQIPTQLRNPTSADNAVSQTAELRVPAQPRETLPCLLLSGVTLPLVSIPCLLVPSQLALWFSHFKTSFSLLGSHTVHAVALCTMRQVEKKEKGGKKEVSRLLDWYMDLSTLHTFTFITLNNSQTCLCVFQQGRERDSSRQCRG